MHSWHIPQINVCSQFCHHCAHSRHCVSKKSTKKCSMQGDTFMLWRLHSRRTPIGCFSLPFTCPPQHLALPQRGVTVNSGRLCDFSNISSAKHRNCSGALVNMIVVHTQKHTLRIHSHYHNIILKKKKPKSRILVMCRLRELLLDIVIYCFLSNLVI